MQKYKHWFFWLVPSGEKIANDREIFSEHEKHRCTNGGGERGRGAPHVPPIKIFEKLPHKNAIKHDPPP
jgi:hypothetical protein